MSRQNNLEINTIRLPKTRNQRILIAEIRQKFGFNEPPFDTIPNALLLLALSPRCVKNPNYIAWPMITHIMNKYGVCDHQTLEYYGDRILYTIISMILYETIPLNTAPMVLNRVTMILNTNRFFTDLMLHMNTCQYVRSNDYIINIQDTSFHNVCADSFEAIIGALYIHLQEYPNPLDLIKNWLLKHTILPFRLKEIINLERIDGVVYTIIDPQTLIPQLTTMKTQITQLLNQMKSNLSTDQYNHLLNLYSAKLNTSPNQLSSYSVIITTSDTLEIIYSNLEWPYSPPLYDNTLDLYYIIGYITDEPTIIGIGKTPLLAENDATNYLLALGYIIRHKNIPRLI